MYRPKGTLIAELREARSLTHHALGDLISVDYRTLKKWERSDNSSDFHFGRLVALANFFGVNWIDLIEEVSDEYLAEQKAFWAAEDKNSETES